MFHPIRSQPVDQNLMRGAVFYIGMALWGFKKVPSLKHTPAAVLPSFLHVSMEMFTRTLLLLISANSMPHKVSVLAKRNTEAFKNARIPSKNTQIISK